MAPSAQVVRDRLRELGLPTILDTSLRRFDPVWCAAGTPHAVFEVATDDLIAAIPSAVITTVGGDGDQ